jgi:hypothetical protein
MHLNVNTTYPNAKLICDALKINKTLKCLALVSFPRANANAIGEMLKVNKSLAQLDLSTNVIENREMKVIIKALKVNKTLKVLGLRKCEAAREHIKLFNGVLKVNTTLEQFKIETKDYQMQVQ